MATTVKAAAISTAKLADAVSQAVKIAADRHQLAIGDTNLIVNWDLVGRQVRDALKGQQFATDVAKDVAKTTGLTLQPATLQVGKLIYVGFYEKARLPIERTF